jgi:hypothetical protein
MLGLAIVHVPLLEVMCLLGTQHGLACLFCFVLRKVGLHSIMGIKCGLQAQDLSIVRCGCFVCIV